MQEQIKRSYCRKYSPQVQRNIIQIYSSRDDKFLALKEIRSQTGCKYLTERKIQHWMGKLKTGKAISTEFEDEVMEECKSVYNNKNSYSYAAVRVCAKKIFDKDYWDVDTNSFVKKWHDDKRTYQLQFTNKWVSGILKRYNASSELKCDIEAKSSIAINSFHHKSTDGDDFDKLMEYTYDIVLDYPSSHSASSDDSITAPPSVYECHNIASISSSPELPTSAYSQIDTFDFDSFEFDDLFGFFYDGDESSSSSSSSSPFSQTSYH